MMRRLSASRDHLNLGLLTQQSVVWVKHSSWSARSSVRTRRRGGGRRPALPGAGRAGPSGAGADATSRRGGPKPPARAPCICPDQVLAAGRPATAVAVLLRGSGLAQVPWPITLLRVASGGWLVNECRLTEPAGVVTPGRSRLFTGVSARTKNARERSCALLEHAFPEAARASNRRYPIAIENRRKSNARWTMTFENAMRRAALCSPKRARTNSLKRAFPRGLLTLQTQSRRCTYSFYFRSENARPFMLQHLAQSYRT